MASAVGQDLPSPGPLPAPSAFNADPTDEALGIYAELTGRTVLRPGSLPPLPASIKSGLPADTNVATAYIADQLAKCQMELVSDGETFVRVLPPGWTNTSMGKWLSAIQPPSPIGGANSNGLTSVIRSDFDAAFGIYADLRGRTILYSSALPRPQFSFRTQRPLPKEEMVYALTVILAMNGIAAIDDGDHFVQFVSLESAPQVKQGAPKPLPSAPLLDPRKLPSLADPLAIPRAPGAGAASITDRLLTLYVKFIGNPPAWASQPSPTVDRLVEFYAALTGCKAQRSSRYGHYSVPFEIKTPLTEAEVLYAIEKTLELNNLTLIPTDQKSIQIGHISARRDKPTQEPSESGRKP